jgi:hypothetical protein
MPASNRLSIVFQPADNHLICEVYSPDGTLANLGNPEVIFGQTPPRDQSGGTLGAVHFANSHGSRMYYTCRSNEGDNTVMLGSIGDAGGIFSPLSTGLGIIGDPFPSAPSIAALGDKLYLFYRPWYNGLGRGSTWCVPVTIIDSNGHFTLGTSVNIGDDYYAGGGRISAVTAGSRLCCTWVDPYNENANGDLQFGYSTDGTNWTAVVCYFDAGDKNAVQGAGSLLVLPNGNLVLGWRDGRNGALTYSIFNFDSGDGYWGSFQTVPGVNLTDEPSWMTSTDGNSVVVACRSSTGMKTFRLSTDLSTVLESRDLSILVGSSPTVLFQPDL